ncbi:MAG: hypothetical protein K0R54_1680 [Clostridiaceae bacterium]|jgi:hypothetical protein|nr:hypothetical protein [Clostridiaceae bacterium]
MSTFLAFRKDKRLGLFILKISILIFLLFQIILGIVWMFRNINCIQNFGDTPEYLELSRTLKFDDYRMILYPYLLNWFSAFGSIVGVSQNIVIYIFQTLMSLGSIIYFLFTFFNIVKLRIISFNISKYKYWAMILFISFCVLTIPVVTQFNFSILTDSLALSFLIVSITCLLNIMVIQNNKMYTYILLCISMLIQFQLRAERVYVFILLIVTSFLFYVLTNKKSKKDSFKSTALIIISFFVALSINYLINSKTQQPGLYGRHPLSVQYTLYYKTLWPNMELCYNDFPDDVKSLFTIEEMKEYDLQSSKLAYVFYPKLVNEKGEKEAKRIIRDCAIIIAIKHPDRIIIRSIYNFNEFLFSPIQVITDLNGITEGVSIWNYSRMAEANSGLTKVYYKVSLYLFVLLLIPACIACYTTNKRLFKRKVILLIPLFLSAFSITTTFAFLTPSNANYRYVLIDFVWWYMVLIAAFMTIVHTDEGAVIRD